MLFVVVVAAAAVAAAAAAAAVAAAAAAAVTVVFFCHFKQLQFMETMDLYKCANEYETISIQLIKL